MKKNVTQETSRVGATKLHEQNVRLRHDLGEREKELRCLYQISELIETPDISEHELLGKIVHLIPPAWQYPEITCVRLTIEDCDYVSDNFAMTRWRQAADIVANGARIGSLEVYYHEEQQAGDEGPFLREERSLLDIVAKLLGRILERKRAEATIHRQEEIFRNLMDFIPGVSIQGYLTDGTVFYWNRASEEVYGYTAQEAIGKNLGDLTVPLDLKPLFTHCLGIGKKIRRSGEFMPSGELLLLHKNGHIVPVHSIHTCVYIEGQEPLLFCIDVDLSEQKKVEEQLKHARTELEIKTKNLEESNTALKVLLEHQDSEKNIIERAIVSSLKTLVTPYLEKVKVNTTDERIKTFVDIIDTNINKIARPYLHQYIDFFSRLTPTEIQILNLICENKTAKDIAGILDISETTVFFHRRNIRNKLGIRNQKINLRSYVQALSNERN